MPEISKTLQPVFTTNFILVTIINLFVFFSFQMIFPTLPLYIKSLGGTDSVIGLVMGTFMITSLATRPFAGLALDKIGRKQVFIIGLVVLGLSAFAYSLAASVTMIVFIRLLHGFGWGIAGTATSTVAAEIIPRERFGEGMGYFSMANSLSLAIALPPVCIFLIAMVSAMSLCWQRSWSLSVCCWRCSSAIANIIRKTLSRGGKRCMKNRHSVRP